MLISMYYTAADDLAVAIINKLDHDLEVEELRVDTGVTSENSQDKKSLKKNAALVISLKRNEVTAYHHNCLITDGVIYIYARYLCYYNLTGCVAKIISFTSHD